MSPFFLLYGKEAHLPDEKVLENLRRVPTDEEISHLQYLRLEHVQDLARSRAEANAQAESRTEKEATQREDQYREKRLGVGDLVKRRHEAEAPPRWDAPVMIRDVTDKNVYQLQTRNGYILRNSYNGQRLQRYYPPSDSKSLWFASSGLRKKEICYSPRKSTSTIFRFPLSHDSVGLQTCCLIVRVVLTDHFVLCGRYHKG